MRVEVFFLVEDVEAGLCLPAGFGFGLFVRGKLVFIDSREGQREVVFGIGVEIVVVLGKVLAELLLLEFPNIEFLARVAVSFNTVGQIDSGLRQAMALFHLSDIRDIFARKVD